VVGLIRAVLFDLDDTLLENNMDHFLKGYFGRLAPHVAHLVPPEKFMPALLAATQAMIDSPVEWAGVADFSYRLVTSYEIMHSCKPHPRYYSEIVDRIGRKPQECVMAGDDWDNDIAPAVRAGLRTYWVNATAETPSGFDPHMRGSLIGLVERLADSH